MSVTKVFLKNGYGHQVTMPILTAMYFLQETRYVVHENCIKNMTWTRRGYLNRGFDVFVTGDSQSRSRFDCDSLPAAKKRNIKTAKCKDCLSCVHDVAHLRVVTTYSPTSLFYVALVRFVTALSHYVTTCITYVVALARVVTTLSHYITTCITYFVALARAVTTLSHYVTTCFAYVVQHYVTTCITYVVALARVVTTLSHYVTTCFAYVVDLARAVTTPLPTLSHYVTTCITYVVALARVVTTLSHYVTTCFAYVVALARAVTTLSHYVTTCFAYVVALARVVTTLSHFAPTRLTKCVIST